MAKAGKISLVWYTKTERGWRRFPVLFKKAYGVTEARHGWVEDKGIEVEYPEGRYQIKSWSPTSKVITYTNVDTLNPRDAVLALQRAQRAAAATPTNNPKAIIKTAAPAYIKYCRDRKAFEAAEHARLVLDEFVPMLKGLVYTRSINQQHFLDFHKKLTERGLSDRTIFNKDARLRSWLKFCDINISFLKRETKPTYEEQETVIYTPGEVKAILEAADPYMRLAISMLLMLGLREQEVMYAEWLDVDFHHATFRVQGKTRPGWKFAVKDKAVRTLPINDDLLMMLKSWQESRPGTTLILGNSDDKPEGHLLRKLKQVARKAGLNCNQCDGCSRKPPECDKWYLHKFRATFLTRMLRQTDAKTVQYLAGHSELTTTLLYLAPASSDEMQAHANAIKWTE